MNFPTSLLLTFTLVGAFTTSCQVSQPMDCDVVSNTYVHRYGVPLDPREWTERGQDGSVVSMRKDGVIVSRSYEAGILHGACTYSFPYREVVKKKEIYEHGVITEEWQYYPNGLPFKQCIFESPQQYSITVWYESGVPHAHEIYEEGKLTVAEYYTPSHQEESRIDGGNGLRYCRSGKGELESVDTIQEGEMIMRTTYHLSGIPSSTTPYVNGVIQGKKCTYTEDGLPATIEEWERNVQHGNTLVFEHGEKVMCTPYVNGCKHGTESRYLDGDQVIQEVSWVKGKKHGPCYHYVENRKVTDWYFRDQLVNKARYDMLCNQ
jgi:antitoxin component YwqK of YwqJK toxin-antitoxin module